MVNNPAAPVGAVRQVVPVATAHEGPYGYMGFHPDHAPFGEFEATPLTDADKQAGWSEIPLYDRNDVLEEAATICDDITHWGLPFTKLLVAKSTQAFCAKAIRAQRSEPTQ